MSQNTASLVARKFSSEPSATDLSPPPLGFPDILPQSARLGGAQWHVAFDLWRLIAKKPEKALVGRGLRRKIPRDPQA